MPDITEDFVDSEAPNANAIKNGRGLLLKSKFVAFHKSPDDSLLFGECSGSGASNYSCSVDFADPSKPVYRCTCPSRQFPCKHCLGLLYAFVDGKKFDVAEIPNDIADKRDKAQKRVEKKKERDAKPKKINKAALKKKITAQLKGLELLDQLTHDLVRTGMGNMNAKLAKQIEKQAKQLSDSYLPGAQAALHGYTSLFVGEDGKFDSEVSSRDRESIYSQALDQLTRLNAIVKQGREYLGARLEDPGLAPETETPIAAWLGHAWQLAELKAAGLVEKDAELIQLAFRAHDDVARREFVDTGVWMNLRSGAIQLTQNFRPYKAAKFIKSEDSCFQVKQVSELCIYPGVVNPRIRWDGATQRTVHEGDLQMVRKHGAGDFSEVVKQLKASLKSPLANKRPIAALNYVRIGNVGDEIVAEDKHGHRIVFTEKGVTHEAPSCHLLRLLPEALHGDQTVIARFHHDLDDRTLKAKPLSIVTTSQIFRLTL